MRIVMVGAGYVGLVTAACFADAGHIVTCTDRDHARIEKLKRSVLPIYEPGLQELVAANVGAGRLGFSSELAENVRTAAAVFIAVGTPARCDDGHADLSQVYAATRELAPALSSGTVVVVKSTVPVGTCDEVEAIIGHERPDLDFDVASNPEFLRAGAAIGDFVKPDRVVIGTDENHVRQRMADIYKPVLSSPTPILFTSRRTSELVKYASNTFLATKIAFINEVANLCERVGADVEDIARGMGLDSRIGAQFLCVGPGFGGSCFPKDALALAKIGEDHEVPMRITETVLASNAARKRSMARKIAMALGGSLRHKTIALLGLTFKPNTDDMREAPAITLASGLRDLHANIRAYDPAGMPQAKAVLPNDVICCESEYEAAQDADAVVLVTEWSQFRALNFAHLRSIMRSPTIIDLRNIYRVEDLVTHGFRYYRIGAPQLVPSLSSDRRDWLARAHPRQRNGGAERRSNGSAACPPGRKQRAGVREAGSA